MNKNFIVGKSEKTKLSCKKGSVGGAEACSEILAPEGSAIEANAEKKASSIYVTALAGFSWV